MNNKEDFEFVEKQEKVDNPSTDLIKNDSKRIRGLILVIVLSLLLPMIGFAVFLKWREIRPEDAKYPGYATLVSVLFGYTILFYWVFIL